MRELIHIENKIHFENRPSSSNLKKIEKLLELNSDSIKINGFGDYILSDNHGDQVFEISVLFSEVNKGDYESNKDAFEIGIGFMPIFGINFLYPEYNEIVEKWITKIVHQILDVEKGIYEFYSLKNPDKVLSEKEVEEIRTKYGDFKEVRGFIELEHVEDQYTIFVNKTFIDKWLLHNT